MMSKTHLAVGIATSLAVIRPQTIQGCAITVIGGALEEFWLITIF